MAHPEPARNKPNLRLLVSTHEAIFFRKIAVRAGLIEFQTTIAAQAIHSYLFFSMAPLRQFGFEISSQVQRIETQAFKDSGLTRILIPLSVEVICESSFRNCRALQWVGFESGRLSLQIEAYAFAKSGLMRIVLPRCVTFLGNHCFRDTESLSAVVFETGSRIVWISSFCFAFSAVAAVVIPSSVEVIAEGAFFKCDSLSSLGFEAGTVLKRIEMNAFAFAPLYEIMLPNSLRFVSGQAFNNCGLMSVSFFPWESFYAVRGEMVEDLSGLTLFRYFGLAETIDISISVETINEYCFSKTRLQSVRFEFDSKLIVIKEWAFAYSGDLKTIGPIPRNIKVLAKNCFYKCQSLENVTFETGTKLKTIEDGAFSLCALTEIVIPRSVEVIKINAFSYCSSLREVVFEAGSRLYEVSPLAFQGCPCKGQIALPPSAVGTAPT
jgi:hypothetical protein